MQVSLDEQQKLELVKRGFSRRTIARVAAMVAAGGVLPFYNESAMAQLSAIRGAIPADAVMLNANENPLGPCPEALEAVYRIAKNGGRYHHGEADAVQELMAAQEGLQPEYVQPFGGSTAPLYQAVLAFCSPSKPFVIAEPGYEAGERAAKFIGAQVLRVPLTANYAHDVIGMAAASPHAGLIYLCNPNNPTGSLTPAADIEWILENKPKGSVLLMDEAYIHFAGDPVCSDLVASDREVIILRTFSKIYGMAGLRAGAALGRPDLLERLRCFGLGPLPATGMAAATASLKSKTLVPERRKIIGDIREDVVAFLERRGFRCVPSYSNKFMVDVKRPGQAVIDALRNEKVYIGRLWPAWPTHVRVSIGTRAGMNKFKAAFLKVTA
ncbi:MAG TPA: pyridoxal phosphate-dependent aminotransferase [Candidatus Acidoferrum sp.]|nr:pyridoxal phosphate-dependent aminotransferase [Candidatus Acidoferrum sp.]